jgi:hypothetical protein
MEGLGRSLVVHMRLPWFCLADDEHNATRSVERLAVAGATQMLEIHQLTARRSTAARSANQ